MKTDKKTTCQHKRHIPGDVVHACDSQLNEDGTCQMESYHVRSDRFVGTADDIAFLTKEPS